MTEAALVSGVFVYNSGDNKVYLKTATGSIAIGVSSDFLGQFNDDAGANAFAATISEEIVRDGTRYWNLTHQRYRQYVSGAWVDMPDSSQIGAAVTEAQSYASDAETTAAGVASTVATLDGMVDSLTPFSGRIFSVIDADSNIHFPNGGTAYGVLAARIAETIVRNGW